MLEIRITVDTNDADYNTSIERISEEDLAKIRPLMEAIKNFKEYKVEVNGRQYTHHCNYPYGGYSRGHMYDKSPGDIYHGVDEEAFEIFEELVPYSEHGFHTVESVEVCPIQEKEKLV